MTASELSELKEDLALACRILAMTGCVREITGHVSARVPGTEDIVVRCRPPEDPGVQFTTASDIHRVTLDATNEGLPDGYTLPGEFPIHSEIYRARPDVGSVVHGHPESALLAGITDLPFEPIFGAYDPAAMQLAVNGVAAYPRAVLISTRELGRDLAAALGEHAACILLGHGVVAVGDDIKHATVTAIKLETLADLSLKARAAGVPRTLGRRDQDEVLEFVGRPGASALYARWTWDFYSRVLAERTHGKRD